MDAKSLKRYKGLLAGNLQVCVALKAAGCKRICK